MELANAAVTEDEADVVILAGAPLAGLADKVKHRIPVPVVDQMAAAIKQAEALASLRVCKATAGTFRRPAAKPTLGLAPGLAARFEARVSRTQPPTIHAADQHDHAHTQHHRQWPARSAPGAPMRGSSLSSMNSRAGAQQVVRQLAHRFLPLGQLPDAAPSPTQHRAMPAARPEMADLHIAQLLHVPRRPDARRGASGSSPCACRYAITATSRALRCLQAREERDHVSTSRRARSGRALRLSFQRGPRHEIEKRS